MRAIIKNKQTGLRKTVDVQGVQDEKGVDPASTVGAFHSQTRNKQKKQLQRLNIKGAFIFTADWT